MRVREDKNSTQRRREHRGKRREQILKVSSLRLSLRSLRLCVENNSLQLRSVWH
jgi:hypothetical protein